MFFYKLLQQLLLPSNLVLVVLLATLIVYIRRKQDPAVKILLTATIIFYYVFSISLTVTIFSAPLIEKYNSNIENIDLSIRKIVLLTGSISDRGNQAIKLYHQLKSSDAADLPPIQIIISGTSAINPSDYSEAAKTKSFLVQRGVPEEYITLETYSRNTSESAANIAKLLGSKPIYLITSDYHMFRSMLAFQQAGLAPIAVPADSEQKNSYGFFDFLPDPENLEKFDLATHEYLGIIYFKLIN